MSLRELFIAINIYREVEESRRVEAWSIMRTQTAYILNLFVKKGKQINPKDLFLLPGDGAGPSPKPTRTLTIEEADKIWAEQDWDKNMIKHGIA